MSAGRYCAKPRAPLLRGTMDTLRSGSACSRNHPAMACPHSCSEMVAFSLGLMSLFSFVRPPITRSLARSKSCISIASTLRRAAKMAASLQMLAMSAPANPGHNAAILLATLSSSRSLCSVTGFKCTLNIASRSPMSGLSMAIWRSKRPGRSKAGSRMSALLVPASTTTPVPEENPSISTSIWFSVFSRSSLPPLKPLLPRLRPTASISSMKMMDGALARACWNRSRTRDGPTPTNISMKSEPLME
mmetsp:Transcript_41321/g.115408  ORF Transcript_41321/g.115408 Transcript_41321/m.115408 type:complete len:246 (+) Transcript_41321:533-1270(+)